MVEVDREEIKLILRILYVTFSAGIGGLLFGYDSGIINASLYVQDDFQSLLHEIISMAVGGAVFGAAIGGWTNDSLGRKTSILIADVLIFLGGLLISIASWPWLIIVGKSFVGLGIGMASMTSPLYISEASPNKIRGLLVGINGFLFALGQFLSYHFKYDFGNKKPRATGNYMIAVAGLPALVQFILMLSHPESPTWLYRKGRKGEAVEVLKKIYPSHEVGKEVDALGFSFKTQNCS